eukprot:scaffold4736_cov434-Prasinococcus_capsulatus_cf.AAC.6
MAGWYLSPRCSAHSSSCATAQLSSPTREGDIPGEEAPASPSGEPHVVRAPLFVADTTRLSWPARSGVRREACSTAANMVSTCQRRRQRAWGR